MFHGHLDYFQKPSLGGRPSTKLGDHGTPNAHNRWFIALYHVWGSTWIEIYWNNIWLRAQSHMTSHYTRGSVTTLHDFGGVLGRPLNTFSCTLTISWSQLLARGEVALRLWEPKRKCLEAVPRHLQIMECGHRPSSVVWSHMWPGPPLDAISLNFYSCGSSQVIK